METIRESVVLMDGRGPRSAVDLIRRAASRARRPAFKVAGAIAGADWLDELRTALPAAWHLLPGKQLAEVFKAGRMMSRAEVVELLGKAPPFAPRYYRLSDRSPRYRAADVLRAWDAQPAAGAA